MWEKMRKRDFQVGKAGPFSNHPTTARSPGNPHITPILHHSISSFGFHGFIIHVFHVATSRDPLLSNTDRATIAHTFTLSNRSPVEHAGEHTCGFKSGSSGLQQKDYPG